MNTKHILSKILISIFSIFLINVTATAQTAQHIVKGVVSEKSSGEILIGVTVHIVGTLKGTSTDEKGEFSITANEKDILRFSYVGFKTYEYTITANVPEKLTIALEDDAAQIKELVIEAGIIQREKFGFTGSFTAVTSDELKSVGNVNVIQSLKTIDPSFVVVENNMFGSNPNMLAEIELRGPTTMNINAVRDEAAITTNLPLFILDGFETTLQVVNDIDINRIESITLLKDAGSTAIYGSKGANGVVVIETIKPKPGQMFISYNGNYSLAVPILNVYNMMNAAEKLEFELLAGRYKSNSQSNINVPEGGNIQQRYFDKLEMVQSGVDSYWLSEPVRVAFTQAHSLTLSGGNIVQYSAGVNYRSTPGVMKGSQRDSYGGNLRLMYRGEQGLSVSNDISVMSTFGQNGSWGSFSDFVNANPYYKKRNDDGTIPKYLDRYEEGTTTSGSRSVQSANPLYNAMLRSRGDNDIFVVTNNTSIDWRVNPELLFRGSVSLTRNTDNNISYTDPAHTQYDGKTYDEKGNYSSRYNVTNRYNANISGNYSKSFDKHNFTIIGRAHIQQSKSTSETLVAVGFPVGSVGFPSQAFSYQQDSRPGYSESTSRNLGVLGAFNYNYELRYLFDFNYNTEGSSNFGRNKRFASFWSVGLGWNLDREAFAENWVWLKEFKIRGTYGKNGNENVNIATASVYSFFSGSNIFGQPVYLSQVGNHDLKWQIVTKSAMGIDIAMFEKSRLRITFDLFKHLTDPLVIQLEPRPSTGVSAYPLNLGNLTTTGFEFRLSYAIIQNDKYFLSARLTGASNWSVYDGFSNALDNLNDEYKTLANSETSLLSLQKYVDGNSPSDLWAMRSLGICPSTGKEIFLTKDGVQTYVYNADDRVVVANSRPKIQGIAGFTFRYGHLTLDASLRYYVGAHQYNSALFNKVENISYSSTVYNQDKRALYDRWQEPGDVAQFKNIALTSSATTPVSSRFIQKDSYIRGEALNLRWSFAGEQWLERFKMKDLTVGIQTADIFTVSTIKIERGIDYPFQRSVQMSISMRF